VKIEFMLVKFFQRRLDYFTRPVIHDLYQRLGKEFIIALLLRQFWFFCASLTGVFGESGNVLAELIGPAILVTHVD